METIADVSLFLFGSVARGDHDASSDMDVLAVYDKEPNSEIRERVLAAVSDHLNSNVALAEYSTERLRSLFAEGHLFAWHIFQEARKLSFPGIGSRVIFPIERPNQYSTAQSDAERFVSLLDSAVETVRNRGGSMVYEAGVAYVCLRNIAMALSSLHMSKIDFTRRSPFHLSRTLGIASPCTEDTYDLLVRARHASQRGCPAPALQKPQLVNWLEAQSTWAHAITREDR